ncbi:uncharacterized protein [Palaemon carinicauda]|uniref:uncharacterized protein n=1 Tax=Palaemon carinicauda TaxID=392227 RepID=UPI0035B58EC1
MIQELSTAKMAHLNLHSVQHRLEHHPSNEEAKSRSCSSESDRSHQSDRSGNSCATCQGRCLKDETTHSQKSNSKRSKNINKKSLKKHNTIDSDFVTYFICRRP